jgi:hypothetical protein
VDHGVPQDRMILISVQRGDTIANVKEKIHEVLPYMDTRRMSLREALGEQALVTWAPHLYRMVKCRCVCIRGGATASEYDVVWPV